MSSLVHYPLAPAHHGMLAHTPNLVLLAHLLHAGRASRPLGRWYVATRLRRLSVGFAAALASDGWSAPPRTVTLTPARDGADGTPCRHGLPLATAYRLADALSPSHSLLTIAGGSPLAWGCNLFPFLAYCRGREVATSLTLDGAGLAAAIARLYEAPPELLLIELSETDTPASVEAREALLHLLALKAGDRWRAPLLMTHVTATPAGIGRLPGLLRHAESLGAVAARVTLADGPAGWPSRARHIAGAAGIACGLPVLIRAATTPCERCTARCAYLRAHADADGAVRICGEERVGSLLEQEFPAIWNGPALRRLRRDLHATSGRTCCGWCADLV